MTLMTLMASTAFLRLKSSPLYTVVYINSSSCFVSTCEGESVIRQDACGLRKAITSRIDFAPHISITNRSSRLPDHHAVVRKGQSFEDVPETLLCVIVGDAQVLNILAWTSFLWIRIDPPPSSTPCEDHVVRLGAKTRPGSESSNWKSSFIAAVKGW